MSFWREGKNTFLSNHPHADISVLVIGQLSWIVAELSNPRLNVDTLSNTIVHVLEALFLRKRPTIATPNTHVAP